MKAMMISIQPQYVANILNGKKTLEIRKTCPEIFKRLKPYEGASFDVYIYCTKDYFIHESKGKMFPVKHISYSDEISFLSKRFENVDHPLYYDLRGKVVAKFTLNKVEEIRTSPMFVGGCPHYYLASCETTKEFYEKSCLDYDTLYDYLKGEQGYAWHIDNLEIFDKPKELKEFVPYCKLCGSTSCCNCKHAQRDSELRFISCDKVKPLTRAPQSWCYVEI